MFVHVPTEREIHQPALFVEATRLSVHDADSEGKFRVECSGYTIHEFDTEEEAVKLYKALSEAMSANLSKFVLENYNFETGDYNPMPARKPTDKEDLANFERLMAFRSGVNPDSVK